MKKRFVFGLGSGRCGTVSLAHLLNSQKYADISHEELEYNLPYSGGERQVSSFLRSLAKRKAEVVGDVFSAYLPYCTQIHRECEEVRFICLRRDRQGTINSFMKKIGPANHWTEHDGTRWISDPWDRCFPKYGESRIEVAIGRYWDDYYSQAQELAVKLDGAFAIFPVEALNSSDGQAELLTFAGFESQRQAEVWENRG